MVLVGQPNMETLTIDNSLTVPWVLSLLVYQHAKAEVKGLDAFPRETWPDNVPLLYYAYHIMIGLGTIFVAVTLTAVFMLWRGRLFQAPWLLWMLMLSAPFPYIATTAGWMTAELGRQPWLVYGLLRTSEGASPLVSSGNALFTLLGFLGLYALLGLLFILVLFNIIGKGPVDADASLVPSVGTSLSRQAGGGA
jgi:cytochrome d ubiquinol oxidase subunit I